MFYYQERIEAKKIDSWIFFSNVVWNFWSSFALLPLVALQTIISNNLESSNGGWRNIFSLSVSRTSIYIAKMLVVALLIFISLCMLSTYVYLYGMIATTFFKSLNFQDYYPPLLLLYLPCIVMGSSLGIISIHYFFSVFLKNVYTSFGFGIFVTMIGLFLIQKQNLAIFFPWGWPALSSTYSNNGEINSVWYIALISSILTCMVVTTLGLLSERKLHVVDR